MSDPTSIKADLVPYTSEYAGQVRSWIDTEETYKLVCRGTNFPPPDDIIDSWQREGVVSYLMFSEGRPVAYGELWDRSGEQAIELNHIIVDQYKRSRGFGTKLIQLLYDRASTRPGIAKVLLNLYNDSQEVLGCYLKAGFEIVGTATHIEGLKMMRLVRK
ncbi:GNAT family N-acetyltransferase [candidate division GN15 bacterium]|nr:GNAT family N-acetyltransferase [candidate division GN15 bacterium]